MSLQQFNQLSWMANDAAMRTRVTDFINAAVAAGLVRTADTGQLDETTILRPTAQNTNRGYMMFGFNDALQATKPVFIKVEVITPTHTSAFNNGTTNVTGNWGEVPSYKFTVGQATDGAGNFTPTGRQSPSRMVGFYESSNTNATAAIANGAGIQKSSIQANMAEGRFLYYWGIETDRLMTSVNVSTWRMTTTGYPTEGNPGMGFFCVERSRDADGTPNGDGISILTAGYPRFNTQGGGTQWNNDGTHMSFYFPYTRALPLQTRWYWNCPTLQPGTRTSSLYNNQLGIFAHYPQEGLKLHNPLISIGGYWANDYTWDGAIPSPVRMYGDDRNYRPLTNHNLHIHSNTALYESIYPMIIWE